MRVHIEFAEPYELLSSLYAYAHLTDQRALDLGPSWGHEAESMVGANFTADLRASDYSRFAWALEVLAWRCPGERSIDTFLPWLGNLSAGETYERLMPYGLERLPSLPVDLEVTKNRCVELLHRWHEGYFQALDPHILAGLAADAESKRALAARVSAQDVIEEATNGIVVEDASDRLVVLVPQFHNRPWNIDSRLHNARIIFYAADAISPPQDGLPPALLRLTRAIADESRLRILRHLAAGEQHTFTELVRLTGLAKSTVHQHMVMLRASGLVRVHEWADGSVSYSLRAGALDSLGDRLHAYITGTRS